MSKIIDLTGQRFGRLLVLGRYEKNDISGHAVWRCLCDCGETTTVSGSNLRSGQIKSCGCGMREFQHSPHTTHGGAASRLYSIWRGMRDRCCRKKNVAYELYGGRGISVCAEWEKSFEVFQQWALANGYRDGLTIDRIDADGDYCPENCCWVGRLEQSRNRRNTRMLTYRGETRPLWEWAELMNIPFSLLSSRVCRGWSAERIFSEPVHTSCRNHKTKN